jgi:hypothetical protein
MAGIKERQSMLNVQQTVDQIMTASQLSRQEYLQLTTFILSDYNVNDEERRQINRIFDDVQIGKLKLVG